MGWTLKGEIVKSDVYVWRTDVTDPEGIVHKYTGNVNDLK